MQATLIIFFGLLGLIIGSFLNVLILRYNTGKGFGGRSMCFSCGVQLGARNLIPAFSFIAQIGRCHSCKSKISPQYILVELSTALLFIVAYLHNLSFINNEGVSVLLILKILIDLLIMSILVFISGYDIKHKIIPDGAAIMFAGLSLISSVLTKINTGFVWSEFWWLMASGLIIAFVFYLAWFLSRGRLIGLGDAKLVVGFGWWLGLGLGFTAVIFGFWIGAGLALLMYFLRPDASLAKKMLLLSGLSVFGYLYVYRIFNHEVLPYIVTFIISLLFILLSKTTYIKRMVRRGTIPLLRMKSEVPFAPFLIAGLLIVYLFRYNIFDSFALLHF